MNERRRELILRVIDGEFKNADVVYQLDQFVHAERMFQYLIQNQLTGKKLYELYLNQFRASWLQLGQWIIMKVNKETKFRPVFKSKGKLC